MSDRARANIRASGFSLLELLVSLSVLLLVLSTALSLYTNVVKLNKSELAVSDTDQKVKNALTLIATEIEAAGSNPDPSRGLAVAAPLQVTAVNGGNITINNTDGINVGNQIVTAGGAVETIKTVARDSNYPSVLSGTITLVSGNSLPLNTLLTARNYPLPQGILYDLAGNGAANWSSKGDTLRLFGDLNQNGAFYLSEYKFVANQGLITRASELITGSVPAANTPTYKVPYTMLENVVPNAGNVPIFRYVKDDQNNVVAVMITITVQPPNDQFRGPDRPRFTYRVTVSSQNVVAASAVKRANEVAALSIPATIPAQVIDVAKY